MSPARQKISASTGVPPPPTVAEPVSPPALDALTTRLRAGGLRLTPARSLMLTALLRCSAPVTLLQLQALLQPEAVALATLFRSMLRLEAIGLVTRSIDLRGTTNWRLNAGRARDFYVTLRDTGEHRLLDPALSLELAQLLERI